MSFSYTWLFGKFARTHIMPIYKKLYIEIYPSHPTPRIKRTGPLPLDFVLSNYAETLPNRIACALFKGQDNNPSITQLRVRHAPGCRARNFNGGGGGLSLGLELLSPLDFYGGRTRSWIRRKQLNLYIENNNGVATLVRGDSANAFTSDTIAAFWEYLKLTQSIDGSAA